MTNTCIRCYLITLLWLGSYLLMAQKELNFEVIGVDNGLSSSVINSVLQDSRGYLWIATRDGLNKYDGVGIDVVRFSKKNNVVSSIIESKDGTLYLGVLGLGLVHYDPIHETFDIYSKDPEDPRSLRDNDITFLHEDDSGNIWAATKLGGFELLDVQTRQFTSHLTEGPGSNVSYFHEDDQGNIWIGADDGSLYLHDAKSGQFTSFPIGTLNKNRVSCIFPTGTGALLLGTENGLFLFDVASRSFSQIASEHIPRVATIWMDNNGQLWVATGPDLLQLDLDSRQTILRLRLSDHEIVPKSMDRNSWNFIGEKTYLTAQGEQAVLVDDDNIFWMITSKGLDQFTPATGRLKEIRMDNSFNNFSRSLLTCAMKDRAGSLWFGTVGGGINKYKDSKFDHYSYKRDASNSLANPGVLSFYEHSNGQVWIGNNGGFFSRFDRKKQTFERYKIPGFEAVTFDLLQSDDQNLWLASAGNGLVNFNLRSGQFQFYKHQDSDPESIVSDQVQRLLLNSDGSMWVGTDKGLDLFNPQTGQFKHVDLGEKITPNTFELRRRENTLWIGTLGYGIFGLNLEDTTIYNRFNAQTLADDKVNDYITSIFLDSAGVLWSGTYGGGLIRIDPRNNSHKVVSTADGLPNSVIYYVAEDSEQNLWLTSNAGLIKLDKASYEILDVFDKDDGLQSNEFNRGAGAQLSDGCLVIGGINGFNQFHPKEVKKGSFQPTTVFTSFKIFGQTNQDILSRIQQGTTTFQLPYDRNTISIGFATLDYRNPSRNQYRYRLQGLSDYWTSIAEGQPTASFTSLDPGTYRFELFTSNSDGIWTEEPYVLTLEISAPYWQRTWFRLTGLALLIAIAMSIPFARIKRLRRQRARLNDLVASRTDEIQAKNQELSEALESLKETQSQLIASEKMASLGVLSAGMGHEINNPLNFIKGGASALRDKVENDEALDKTNVQPIIDAILEGVTRASNIVESLGQFSRKGTKMDEDCCLDDILENCLVLLENKIKGRIDIERAYEATEMVIKGNSGRLHQAFLNILSNAAQAIDGKGTISIKSRTFRKKFQITIADDGTGIPNELIDKVMDPFFTTKPPGAGTGLGLSITYNIIKEHKGKISISSTVNQGTAITITL